jgi:OOP family OmpA-OmpF porin
VLTGNLTAKGYGETVPVMANDTEENREKNRRIEFRLLSAAADSAGDSTAVTVLSPDEDTIRPKKRPAQDD